MYFIQQPKKILRLQVNLAVYYIPKIYFVYLFIATYRLHNFQLYKLRKLSKTRQEKHILTDIIG
jgi:hypothetical protein